MIPLWAGHPTRAVVRNVILVALLAVFLLVERAPTGATHLSASQSRSLEAWATIPCRVNTARELTSLQQTELATGDVDACNRHGARMRSSRYLATLVTSTFLHIDLEHLAWNAAFLFALGAVIELTLGRWALAITFLGGGLVGAVAQTMLLPNRLVPVIGASGGVAAVLAAATVLEPGRWVRSMMLWPAVVPLTVPVWVLALSWVGGDSLAITGPASTVAVHTGGALFGLGVGVVGRHSCHRTARRGDELPTIPTILEHEGVAMATDLEHRGTCATLVAAGALIGGSLTANGGRASAVAGVAVAAATVAIAARLLWQRADARVAADLDSVLTALHDVRPNGAASALSHLCAAATDIAAATGAEVYVLDDGVIRGVSRPGEGGGFLDDDLRGIVHDVLSGTDSYLSRHHVVLPVHGESGQVIAAVVVREPKRGMSRRLVATLSLLVEHGLPADFGMRRSWLPRVGDAAHAAAALADLRPGDGLVVVRPRDATVDLVRLGARIWATIRPGDVVALSAPGELLIVLRDVRAPVDSIGRRVVGTANDTGKALAIGSAVFVPGTSPLDAKTAADCSLAADLAPETAATSL